VQYLSGNFLIYSHILICWIGSGAMVRSMTGFGTGKAERDQIRVTVEIKTVNHRFCEYSVRMPRQFLALEDRIKKRANEYIRRGRAEIYINLEGEELVSKKLLIDWDLANQLFTVMETASAKYSIPTTLTLQDLLQLEGLVSVAEEPAKNGDIEDLLIKALTEALEKLTCMRQQEGNQLKHDLQNQIDKIRAITQELITYAPSVINQYREKLSGKLIEWTEGKLDESRLVTEVAIFADKADINEELTRLESHFIQFAETLELEEPIGRKLDFLVQEMNREVNTIGSKANDAQITKNVVEMKSLLEKIKEQVQNIE
jgi:uncharacterized protein (TIGR00255 family)